jgi:two-component system sensor histidine kinase VanS
MRKNIFGLFGKIFLYTLMFLVLAITVFTFFYAQQLRVTFSMYERRQLTQGFQPLLRALEHRPKEEMAETAALFRERNESFEFSIQTNDGTVIFETPDFFYNPVGIQELTGIEMLALSEISFSIPLYDDITIHIANIPARDSSNHDELMRIIPLSIALLAASAICAFILARLIARPIKKLASDTARMSQLENVIPPPMRKDEIGMLAQDVHKMYERLKQTIGELEDEIDHKEAMEESQRYFFSAASHELKTPIAGTIAILEGMIGKVIESEDYQGYLQQCLSMMNAQSRLINEILDIVRFNDGRIKPRMEIILLTSLVEAVLPMYQTLADAKEQNISVNILDEEKCHADKTMLNRVLSNVVMNAVQNSPVGSEIRIWSERVYEVAATDDKLQKIRFYVLNTSTNIEEEMLSKLFEPFYRADKSRSRSQGRSGLGLTIVKKALDAMEIPFVLENIEEGVLFRMDLPMEK